MADERTRRDAAHTLAGKADLERLLADGTVSVERKIELLDARERELRQELLQGRPSARAAERDDADAYHFLNDVLGALGRLRGEGGKA